MNVPKGHGGPTSITLQPGPHATRAARRFVLYAAAQWLGDAKTDEVMCVVTELVGNAVLHARTPMVLNLCRRGDAVRIELYDGSSVLPARRAADPAQPGLGLRIVDGFVQRWGVDLCAGGKLVWAEV
ncbi:MAG TPA: ATP-binding protein [Acidimicrobiales bacterium]